jgi:hypothetical protein
MWRYMTEKSNPPNDTLRKHYIICDERYNDHRRGYDYETMKDSRRVDMYVEFKDMVQNIWVNEDLISMMK